jgi:phage-related protein
MLSSASGAITDTASDAYESVSNAASGAYGSVSNVAGTAYNSVSNVASSAASGVSSAASNAYSGVTNAASTAYEKVGELGTQSREYYDYYIEENPLAVGAVALALGAAVGLSIPASRVENHLMGETKQNLLNLAQDRAGELVDRVKQVASEAQKTIGEEIKTQTLTQ